MPSKKPSRKKESKNKSETPTQQLIGWEAIAKFLGHTPAVAQRWHESGMPVEHHGKRVFASPQELTRWVGTESGKTTPIHISDEQENLLADLKAGLAFVRRKDKQ